MASPTRATPSKTPMHELGLVLETISSVEQIAKEHDVKSVTSVTLEIGEVSGVVPSLFEECFDWAKKKTEYMHECKLEVVVIQGITYCRSCKKTYPTVEHGKICPHCKSEDTYLLTGNELTIHDIKVESKDEAA